MVGSGSILGDTYRLGQQIGRGGMGTVFAAEHLRLSRTFAVKLLNPELKRVPEAFERFRQEARICGALGNRHIVDVVDFNEADDGTPYMVMEMLQGHDLAQVIDGEGPRPPLDAARILRQICSALAATHDEGILHRDLKPSNVFLCDDDEGIYVKLLDFGIAKARDSLISVTGSGTIVGTPAYMAPETALCRRSEVGPASDLFSVGAIGYAALTGRPAFDGDSIPGVLYQVVNHQPPAPHAVRPGTPEPLSLLVMQLLQKDPLGRPRGAREVGRTLAEIERRSAAETRTNPVGATLPVVGPLATPAPAIPPTVVVQPPRARRRLALALGVGATLLAALALVGLWGWSALRTRQSEQAHGSATPAPRPGEAAAGSGAGRAARAPATPSPPDAASGEQPGTTRPAAAGRRPAPKARAPRRGGGKHGRREPRRRAKPPAKKYDDTPLL